MKNKKYIKTIFCLGMFALFMVSLTKCEAQATNFSPDGSIAISLHQDIRLATLGDNKGNDAFTLNFLARVKLEGNQDEWGYTTIYPEYEYANLKGGKYVRYSLNIAYVLNQIFKDIELSTGFGYGWIDRQGTSSSISLNSELAYYLSDRLKLSLAGQYTQRQDIETWRYSSFFGVEFKL